MALFLNFGLAWLAIGLTLLLSVIFMTRKMIKNASHQKAWIKINLKLRKFHKEIGILLILVGLIHGLNSSWSVWTWNMGTLAWILSIILGLNWLFRAPLSKSVQWIKIHRGLTVAFILVLLLHINEVGGVQIIRILSLPDSSEVTTGSVETPTIVDVETATSGKQLTYGIFTDGTYTGVATGYGSGLTVEVVIKDNTITSITIIDHNERNTRYYAKAFNTMPSRIVDAQSLDVDTVSGATFSSVGIINAVNDALKDALVSGSLPSTTSLPTKRGH